MPPPGTARRRPPSEDAFAEAAAAAVAIAREAARDAYRLAAAAGTVVEPAAARRIASACGADDGVALALHLYARGAPAAADEALLCAATEDPRAAARAVRAGSLDRRACARLVARLADPDAVAAVAAAVADAAPGPGGPPPALDALDARRLEAALTWLYDTSVARRARAALFGWG